MKPKFELKLTKTTLYCLFLFEIQYKGYFAFKYNVHIYKPIVNIHHEMATNIQTNDLSEFMTCLEHLTYASGRFPNYVYTLRTSMYVNLW